MFNIGRVTGGNKRSTKPASKHLELATTTFATTVSLTGELATLK